MYRLTTPRHKFKLPAKVPPQVLEWALVSYEQNDKIILEKDLAHLDMDGQVLYVLLTQEETKLFDWKTPAWVQLRCGYGSLAFASRKFQITVKPVINNDVLPNTNSEEV